MRASKATSRSNNVYAQLLHERMVREVGVEATNGLRTCIQPQNDTVLDCPQKDTSVDSFIVIAHNSKGIPHKQFVRILLPRNTFKAETWIKKEKRWVAKENFDILE